jgi:large subunit ribosomal protein L2
MAIKAYRPVTPTLRYKTTNTFEALTTDVPHKALLVSKKRSGGRNSEGHMTVRHRGGGHKRYYRIMDFKRDKFDIPGVVQTIEYDPNRTCFIALVNYKDGEKRYILASANMHAGMNIISSRKEVEPVEGNCLELKYIPLGTMIHNIEMLPDKGGQIVRTAGSYGEVLAKENQTVQLRLPSGEIRTFPETCLATVGQVGNSEHMKIVIGSAGRNRWKGWRPHVRGVAMNPVDHPNGGGEGRSKGGGGRQHPRSPWGQKSKGLKTRKRKKPSGKWIVHRRK